MQKYDENIKKSVIFAVKSVKQVEKILSEEGFETKDLQKVADIYSKSLKAISFLNDFVASAEFGAYFEANSEFWNTNINILMEIDKRNLDKITELKSEAGNKVRELNKQKNLLIYKK